MNNNRIFFLKLIIYFIVMVFSLILIFNFSFYHPLRLFENIFGKDTHLFRTVLQTALIYVPSTLLLAKLAIKEFEE